LGVEAADFILPSEYKDMNEALVKGLTVEAVESLAALSAVAARTPPACEEVPEAAAPPAADPAKAGPAGVLAVPSTRHESPTVDQSDGTINLDFGARKYRIRGLTAKNLDALRVNIKVEASGGHHLDTFDLYSAKSRASFVGCCRKIFEAEEGELHKELNRIIAELERAQGGMIDGKAAGEKMADEPPPMTAEEEAEALAALRRPSLLEDITKDMEALGYVGEEHNKTVGYLVGVSRKMSSPLSCVTISQSGAGKSILVETVEKMTPPEDVRMYSRITQYSLYYEKQDGFKHRLLISEERAGAEEADYSIRTLQSKKRLTLAVPVKDPATNQIRTETRIVEGPVAYMETTTKPRINDENATRCFELFLDESEEQTRLIHERQRWSKTLEGLIRLKEEEAICRRHHRMQRLLRPIAVVIPGAVAEDAAGQRAVPEPDRGRGFPSPAPAARQENARRRGIHRGDGGGLSGGVQPRPAGDGGERGGLEEAATGTFEGHRGHDADAGGDHAAGDPGADRPCGHAVARALERLGGAGVPPGDHRRGPGASVPLRGHGPAGIDGEAVDGLDDAGGVGGEGGLRIGQTVAGCGTSRKGARRSWGTKAGER
jgi:hypothetical protein